MLGIKEFACSPGYRLACTTAEDTCTIEDDCGSFESCYPQNGAWTYLEEDCA